MANLNIRVDDTLKQQAGMILPGRIIYIGSHKIKRHSNASISYCTILTETGIQVLENLKH